MKFTTKRVKMPEHDCDVVLTFPSGKKVTIQSRPSNADVNYEGSLDFLLPSPVAVACTVGDDMAPSQPVKGCQWERVADQLTTEIPS